MCKDIESKNLWAIVASLKDTFKLSAYNFAKSTVIIQDKKSFVMYKADVIIEGDIVLFKNIVQKEENFLTVDDIK